MKNFDVAIVGGGPGGYVAAIHAAKSGLSVALIEGRDLGGTCLNRGCIPSKALLKHAEVIERIKDAKRFGITVDTISFKFEEMLKRKNQVVQQLRNGVTSLLKQNKITVYDGYASVCDDKTIKIETGDADRKIKADHVILANGSKPMVPEIPGLGDISRYTSDTIFDIEETPSHIVIVGGGVIGLEIATIFNSLDTKVEVVEMANQILPSEDPDAALFLAKQMKKKGIKLHTSAKITGFKKNDRTIVELEREGQLTTLETDCVLLAIGRLPNLTGLDNLSIDYDGRFVKTDRYNRTSIDGIYAIGDLIGGYQLAHAASKEGIQAVNHMNGKTNEKEALIPRCVYTFPEIASIGMTEKEARETGYKVKTEKVDITANGKAIAAGENNGFMKIVSEEKHGEILGVVMVGSHVTEMISQATSYMHLEGTIDELHEMVFPHPTISETLFEAAAKWQGQGIHY